MKILMDLDVQLVEDTLETAFYGGIAYWAQIKRLNVQSNVPLSELAMQKCIVITIFDKESGKEFTLTREKVIEGLKVMQKIYPEHFSDIISENSDATTGDVLVQCAIFGKIVYG